MYKVTYNSKVLDNSDNLIINVSDLGVIPIRLGSMQFAESDGGIIYKKKYSFRDIKVFGQIFGSNENDYKTLRKLLSDTFVNDGIYKDLEIFYLNETKYSKATVISFNIFQEKQGEAYIASYEAILRLNIPYFHGGLQKSEKLYITAPGGTPVPIPVPAPVTGGKNSLTIINNGVIKSYPTIYVYNQCQQFTITNSNGNQVLIYSDSISNGQYLKFGYENGVFFALKNGVDNVFKYTSNFLTLELGVNNFYFNSNTYSSNTYMEIEYYIYTI